MAAPLSGANVDIGDGELMNSGSDTSPAEASIPNNKITTTIAIDDGIKSQTADSIEPTTSKDCLQVTGDGDIIMDEENSEIIKRKKLSLTLPLLNIVDTAGAAHPSCDAASPNGTIAGPSTLSSCKTKKIYESDDTFIQTIFSQTIKSTTVTPTDDDASYAFEDFHGTRIRGSISSQQTKSDSLLTDDTPVEKLETPIDGMSPSTIVKTSFFDKRLSETSDILQIDGITSPLSDKPTETFAYFHQTIDEDEPPFSDVVDMETVATVEGADAAAAVADDNNSAVDVCLDELIDSPVDIQTNTESLTNATCANANATNTITIRTASCTQDIAQITLSSPSPVLESEPTSGQCGDGGGGGDNDDCPNVNDNNHTNTNASNTEQGNDASEQINAADAISSYDDEHTETEQNNTLTSNNSSLHVSSVFALLLSPFVFVFFLLLLLLRVLIDFSVGNFFLSFFIQILIIIILTRAG